MQCYLKNGRTTAPQSQSGSRSNIITTKTNNKHWISRRFHYTGAGQTISRYLLSIFEVTLRSAVSNIWKVPQMITYISLNIFLNNQSVFYSLFSHKGDQRCLWIKDTISSDFYFHYAFNNRLFSKVYSKVGFGSSF